MEKFVLHTKVIDLLLSVYRLTVKTALSLRRNPNMYYALTCESVCTNAFKHTRVGEHRVAAGVFHSLSTFWLETGSLTEFSYPGWSVSS